MERPPVCRTPLSVHRTFVVQFRAETDANLERVVGRVEHVASQQAASFRSWGDPQGFMARILGELQARSVELL